MLERLKDLPAGVVGISAKGKVTKDDYTGLVHPMLEEARREGKRLRFLYELGAEFTGFTAGAAWQDARLGMQYLRLFERCAVVTDVAWVRESVEVATPMMPCPVRVFGATERQAALTWLATPARTGLTHRLLADKGVLVLEPTAPLAAEDFDALAAFVDPWIESHGGLSGVVIHMRTFPGWETFGGMLRHVRFVRDHERKVRRIALASDAAIADVIPKIVDHFVDAEVKPFAYAAIDDAIAWASGAPASTKAAVAPAPHT